MATFAYTPGTRQTHGSRFMIPVKAVWNSSTYTASGEYLYANIIGLNVITDIEVEDSASYLFDTNVSGIGDYFRLKAYVGTTGTSGATTAGTPAGTVDQVTGTVAQVTGTNTDPVATYITLGSSYLRGSANTSSDAADQASSPTNGAFIYALAAANNTTTITTFASQPDVARNVCVCHKNTSGGNLAQVACVYTFTGTYNGAAQTDTVTFADTSNIATTKFRYVYGVKPFDTITSVTINFAQGNVAIQRSIGLGSMIGFPRTLFTPAEADVVKFALQGVAQTITGTVSTTNNTINVGTPSDGNNLLVKFASKGYDAAPGFTGSTPAFTGSTPTFHGSALATHSHTITGAITEMSGSMTASIDLMVYGY